MTATNWFLLYLAVGIAWLAWITTKHEKELRASADDSGVKAGTTGAKLAVAAIGLVTVALAVLFWPVGVVVKFLPKSED